MCSLQALALLMALPSATAAATATTTTTTSIIWQMDADHHVGGGGRWVQDQFAISFFAQTHKPPVDDASFKLMSDGNFTMVGLFDHLGSSQLDAATTALQQRLCRQYGLKCLLGLANFKKSKNGSRTLPQVSPTQWGFYLADEPNAKNFPSLAKDVAAVREAAPGSMTFINLLPSNVSHPPGEWGADNYSEYARQLVDVVKPDVVCFDHYPNFGRVIDDARAQDSREDYVRNLELAGAAARRAQLPLWLYFNIVPYGGNTIAMPHEGHEDPTEAQIRWQISVALAYGVTGLLYFEWHPMGDGHPGLVMSVKGPPVPSPHYFQAKRLNSWVLALAPTLLHAVPLVTVNLRQARDTNPAAVLAAASGANSLGNISRGDWVLGFFDISHRKTRSATSMPDDDGDNGGARLLALTGNPTEFRQSGATDALMITNYEHAYIEWATVEWQDGLTVLEIDGSSGQAVAVADDAPDIPGLQLRFEPGEGRLFTFSSSQPTSIPRSSSKRVKIDDDDDGQMPTQWRVNLPKQQHAPQILTLPFALPSAKFGGEFVPGFLLLPNRSTLVVHVPGYCAGLPAGCGIPQAIYGSVTNDSGFTWSPLVKLVDLTSPPNCSGIWKPGYCGWGALAFASSDDLTRAVGVIKSFPYGDFGITIDWNHYTQDFEWSKAATPRPAFVGAGKAYPERGVDSGGTCAPVTLASGRTVFSFEWDNFSQPDGSPEHANITLCHNDPGAESWVLSKTQAPAGHPMRNGTSLCDGANEPSSVELNNGSILTFIRTQTGYLWQTLSTDGGENLSPATQTAFVSSDSPPLLLRLRHSHWKTMARHIPELTSERVPGLLDPILLLWINGDTSLPLACVDSAADCIYATRFILHAAISLDDGHSWHGFREVYRDPYLRIPPASTSGDYGAAYTYGAEQADGSVIFESGQSGTAPSRWNVVSFDPRFLLESIKVANFSTAIPGAVESAWNNTRDLASGETVTSCVYHWNLCRDPGNKNRSAPHCDSGGDGVHLTEIKTPATAAPMRAVCAALAPPATQATFAWNFPATKVGVLRLRLLAQSGFSGANISLSDFFAPTWDLATDWASGRIAGLLMLPIAAGAIPTGEWLDLHVQWTQSLQASWSLSATSSGKTIGNGTLGRLRAATFTANAPSYLRVRSLGPGGVCVQRISVGAK